MAFRDTALLQAARQVNAVVRRLKWFSTGVPMRLALLVGGILVFATAPAAAQSPDVQFLSDTVSTDLLLAESKEPIHWLRLQCRLADGGKGTLTLDATVPKFNEFHPGHSKNQT